MGDLNRGELTIEIVPSPRGLTMITHRSKTSLVMPRMFGFSMMAA